MVINFLYGTAWKEAQTEDCVFRALKLGYRGIDTANQRKHYYEEGVGHALQSAYSQLGITRTDLFLQTKFTYARGQDHRKPYNEKASYSEQVCQSFESSLQHLQTEYLDSYILHGSHTDKGLDHVDWETWGAMENLYQDGKVKHLGISNVNLQQLVELFQKAKIKPSFVQNRCFAVTRWDKNLRELCSQNRIEYQGFSLLTANKQYLGGEVIELKDRNIPKLGFIDEGYEQKAGNVDSRIQSIISETGKNIQQIIFKFSQQVGMIPITGTRSDLHMRANLEIDDLILSSSQLEIIENIAYLQ
jgi:diketogulonate reductase-like aldo/keto reductase